MIDYRMIYNETKLLSVLIVEDYEPLRKEMKEVLEDLFKVVICAKNGVDARELYETAHNSGTVYDMVICDIQMPKMNGIKLSNHIRKLNDLQVIIMLSGHTDSVYLLELINMGISKFITKPIDYDIFFPILHEAAKKINILKSKNENTNIVQISDEYFWDTQTKLLKHKDMSIILTKHELILLEFFLTKIEQICENKHIIDYFNNYNIIMSEKNIRNLVFKLRQKIPNKCIVNIYGYGYKFIVSCEV